MFHVQLDESKNVWKEPCTGGLLILGTEGFGICRLTQSQPQEELSSYTSARHADHKVCCGTWRSISQKQDCTENAYAVPVRPTTLWGNQSSHTHADRRRTSKVFMILVS